MEFPGFIFGGNTPWSYEELQRKRAIAEQLRGANMRAPQNVGEGLSAIGRALQARRYENRASERETELRSQWDQQFGSLFGGASATPGTSSASAALGGPVGMSPESRQAAWDTAVSWNPTQPTMAAPPDMQTPILETQLDAVGNPAGPATSDMSLSDITRNQSAQDMAAQGAGPTQDALQLAAQQLGMDENDQRAALQSYMADGGVNLDPAVTAWCAAYVNASLAQSGQPTTGSNMARSFESWGQPVYSPQPGDVAVYPRGAPGSGLGHVGFVNAVGPNGQIELLGGNQGNAVTIQGRNASDATAIRRGFGGGAVGPMPQTQGGNIPTAVASRLPGMPQAAPQAAPQPAPQAAPDMQQIMAALNNPMATPEQKQVLMAMLEQQMNPPQADQTSAMQNYQFLLAQGMAPADAMERAFSGGGTNVNVNTGSEVGTIPQGYELFVDPETGARSMRPIPGGPEDTTQFDELGAQDQAASAVNVLDVLTSLQQEVEGDPMLTGLIGSIMQSIPGSGAYDAARTADTIKANLAFDALAAMRASSPTGGALGAVSERELMLLEAQISSLDLGQSQAQVLANIERIRNEYTRILRKAYETGDPVQLDALFGGHPSFLAEGRVPSSSGATGDEMSDDDLLRLYGGN